MGNKNRLRFPVTNGHHKRKDAELSDFDKGWFEDSSENGGKSIRDEYLDPDNEIKQKKDKRWKSPSSSLGKEWLGLQSEDGGRSLSNEYLSASGSRSWDEDVKKFDDVLEIQEPLLGIPPPKKPQEKKVDPVIAIVKDFKKHFTVAVVGGAIYIHNGIFYEFQSDRKIQASILKRYLETPGIAGMVERAVKILRIYPEREELEEFPVNSNIIVFGNGTLELRTMEFRDNSPDDMANSALAIIYDPKRRDMPNIKRFFKTVCGGDGGLYERILQAIGYILSNDISAKAFFYLKGVGDSGKSLFSALIAAFFPETGANKVGRLALQDFGGKFALASLVNARLNISEDLPDTILTPVTLSRVKMLSDFNRVECEQKYMPAYSYRFLCKLLFASNHPLRIKEKDEAFGNRVVYIPFDYAIPKEEQDKQLLQKMLPELPALFNHALEAYQQLVKNGYKWAGDFEPEIIISNSPISPDKSLVIKRFMSRYCILDGEATISVDELKRVYERYCLEYGYDPIIGDRFSREFLAVADTEFPEKIERIKIGNQQRGYRGIRLTTNL